MRELDPPGMMPLAVRQEGEVTGTFGFFGKGKTMIEGQLLTPRASQNTEAMIRLAIDNSSCGKMVDNIQFKLRRTIIAYGLTHDRKKKEFKDEQVIMFGKFEDKVAKNEPNLITRDYAISMRKTKFTDKELNRVIMVRHFESGKLLPNAQRRMQDQLLPSLNTPNMRIEYEVIAMVSHESMFSSNQELPAVHLPLYVTVDPQGPFDLGRDGLQLAEERR